MGNAKLHRIFRFRMGSHHLPVEEGRHFNLPRASRVCNLCNTDALGMRGICCLNALPWQISGCNSLHSCCRVPAS